MVTLIGLFVFWRIESVRVERLRAELVDFVAPSIGFGTNIGQFFVDVGNSMRTWSSMIRRNDELEREVARLKNWRERALRLEKENAELRRLAKVQPEPAQTSIAAKVLADTSSQFRYSILVNLGSANGIIDGWPATDGLGIVGRVSGVSKTTSRIILLTDPNSRVPAKLLASGISGLVVGDNTPSPKFEMAAATNIRPGERVVTSGRGGVFPEGLLIGEIAIDADKRPRIRLAADYRNLDYLSILRKPSSEKVESAGELIIGEVAGDPGQLQSADE